MSVLTPSDDEVRRLLAEAVGGLEPSADALDAIRAGYTERRRLDHRRRWIVGGTTALAIAAGIAVVLAMVTTTQPKRQTLRVATPSVSPADALAAYVAGVPNVVVKSVPTDVGGDQIAILGITNGPHDQHIRVLNFAGGSWHQFVDRVLPEPSYDLIGDRAIDVADVTADGRSDFLVHVMAGDNAPGVVVSDQGGTWRLVPMSADPSDVYAGRDPVFRSSELVTQSNDCVPDCASGHVSEKVWRYNASKGHFEVTDESQAVKTAVETFYKAYNDLAIGPNGTVANGAAFVKTRPDVTDRFKAYVSGSFDHDPVTCAQNTSPYPFTTEKPAINGSTATVVAHQFYTGGSSNLRVTLKRTAGAWQIDAVTCL